MKIVDMTDFYSSDSVLYLENVPNLCKRFVNNAFTRIVIKAAVTIKRYGR